MKISGATSGQLTTPPIGRQSAGPPGHESRSTQSADGGYPLVGPSDLPDPTTNAYRADLADVSLAGRVIASHYSEPLARHLIEASALHDAPDGEILDTMNVGDTFLMLDCTGGWAWGYGKGERVGYVRGEALGF